MAKKAAAKKSASVKYPEAKVKVKKSEASKEAPKKGKGKFTPEDYVAPEERNNSEPSVATKSKVKFDRVVDHEFVTHKYYKDKDGKPRMKIVPAKRSVARYKLVKSTKGGNKLVRIEN